MKSLFAPVNCNSPSAEITNLQDGLLLLLGKQLIRVSDSEQRVYEEGLLKEQKEQVYKDINQNFIRQ